MAACVRCGSEVSGAGNLCPSCAASRAASQRAFEAGSRRPVWLAALVGIGAVGAAALIAATLLLRGEQPAPAAEVEKASAAPRPAEPSAVAGIDALVAEAAALEGRSEFVAAIAKLETSLDQAGLPAAQGRALARLAALHERMGGPAKALRYYQMYRAVCPAERRAEIDGRIARLQKELGEGAAVSRVQ